MKKKLSGKEALSCIKYANQCFKTYKLSKERERKKYKKTYHNRTNASQTFVDKLIYDHIYTPWST